MPEYDFYRGSADADHSTDLGVVDRPIVWSAIGGSAASLLGVGADYALPVAGLTLVLSLMFPMRHLGLVRSQA